MKEFLLGHKERQWAYDRWCEGYTQYEIAEAMNVSHRTVNRALRGKVKIKRLLEPYKWDK